MYTICHLNAVHPSDATTDQNIGEYDVKLNTNKIIFDSCSASGQKFIKYMCMFLSLYEHIYYNNLTKNIGCTL